jgi:hypothetical protein
MKRLHYGLLIGSMAALLAGGCAPATSVGAHIDPNVTFSHYRTFAWGPVDPLPSNDPKLARSAFLRDHIQGAVERGLAARGLALTSSPTPDLLIHYHLNVRTRIDPNRVDRLHGYCVTDNCRPKSVHYDSGTLVLDVIDLRTNKLLWRGWARNSVEDMLRSPGQMAMMIDQDVTDMLRWLPRRPVR